MSNSESFTDTGATSAFYQGVEAERARLLEKLTKLTDRFNRGETEANQVMYLYRFIDQQRKEK